MSPLNLLVIVALVVAYALAWHDQSARDSAAERRFDAANSLPELHFRQHATNGSAATAPESAKIRNV